MSVTPTPASLLSLGQSYARTLYEIRLLVICAGETGCPRIGSRPVTYNERVLSEFKPTSSTLESIDAEIAALRAERIGRSFADPPPAWLDHRKRKADKLREEMYEWILQAKLAPKGKGDEPEMSWLQRALLYHEENLAHLSDTEEKRKRPNEVHTWDSNADSALEAAKHITRSEKELVLLQREEVSTKFLVNERGLSQFQLTRALRDPRKAHEVLAALKEDLASYAHAIVWTDAAHELLIKDKIAEEVGQLEWILILYSCAGEAAQSDFGTSPAKLGALIAGVKAILSSSSLYPDRVEFIRDKTRSELFYSVSLLHKAYWALKYHSVISPDWYQTVCGRAREVLNRFAILDESLLNAVERTAFKSALTTFKKARFLQSTSSFVWGLVSPFYRGSVDLDKIKEVGVEVVAWQATKFDFDQLARKNKNRTPQRPQTPPPPYSESSLGARSRGGGVVAAISARKARMYKI